ncbi:hypothetical protein [Niabella sp.]|uniref:hypothetical protein n=1 Tax=Niabella sp. TaxID=1962976 RepID=UPI00262AD1BD|nr:hypothetical protein [Niabella sp.]
MKRGGVLMIVYSLMFALGFLLLSPAQKTGHRSPDPAFVQKTANYTTTPDLPVFPTDLFLDRTDDKEEDVAPGLHEQSFADFPHWVISWIPNPYQNGYDKEKLYRKRHAAYQPPEKYIFFRSIRV